MKSASYEKPGMKFVDLRSEQQIAAAGGPCMPQSTNGHGAHGTYYYDAPGDGWVQIINTNTNCNGSIEAMIWTYIDNQAIPGEVDEEAQAKAILAAQNSMAADKQAFSGAVVDNPDPSWS